MKKAIALRFRPSLERLAERDVPAFLAPITSAGGGGGIAAGDVNLDGYADVAVLSGKNVVVSLGHGDGTFQPWVTLTGAKGPVVGLAIDDWNGDGRPDVAAVGHKPDGWTTNWFGERVRTYTVYMSFWYANADGTFQPVSVITMFRGAEDSGGGPDSAIGDFNRNGVSLVDVASVDTRNDSVNVYLSNADGTRQPALTFPAGPRPTSLAAGDFNGDGWTDLVVTNGSTLTVLLNDGNW
jgi:hypothetical protein